MRKASKILALLTAVAMLGTLIAGCGKQAAESENVVKQDTTQKVEQKQEPVKEPVKLTMFVASTEKDQNQNVVDMAKEAGIIIEQNLIPGDGVEYYKKLDILLASGDKTDLLSISNPMMQYKYQKADWLLPLDDLMKSKNYDANKVFGKYMKPFNGKTYLLPYSAGGWFVIYNKKIFDDAKVSYPPLGKWTWSQYIETAKKLTDKSKGIYGSYMLDYDCYFFFDAVQRGAKGYKEDGTSNYDDPAYKNAMKFFVDLGNVHKIQPSWSEFKTKKLAWDGFMSGKYGMWFIGTWASGLIADKKGYPRDWKVGVATCPVPDDGTGNNNFGVASTVAINKNTEHPDEAFDALKFVAENRYKANKLLPSRQDISPEDFNKSIQSIADGIGGDVTLDELKTTMANDGLGFVDEKIVGPAMAAYSEIILQEGEKYAVGGQSLDDAVKNIKKRADEAIAKEKAAK